MYALLLTLAGLGQLTFTGPDAVEVGQPVTIKVTGLPEPDLSKPLGESFGWLDDVLVDVSCPDGSDCVVESSIGLNIAPLSWRLELEFTPKVAGVYVLAYVYFGEQRQVQMYRVQAGQAPQPPPDPPNPPTPTNVARVFLIYESEEMTAEQGTLHQQIRNESLPVTILDKNTTDEDDQPLPLLQAASEAISKGLPRLVGYSEGGSVVVDEPCPATAREVGEMLERWGL